MDTLSLIHQINHLATCILHSFFYLFPMGYIDAPHTWGYISDFHGDRYNTDVMFSCEPCYLNNMLDYNCPKDSGNTHLCYIEVTLVPNKISSDSIFFSLKFTGQAASNESPFDSKAIGEPLVDKIYKYVRKFDGRVLRVYSCDSSNWFQTVSSFDTIDYAYVEYSPYSIGSDTLLLYRIESSVIAKNKALLEVFDGGGKSCCGGAIRQCYCYSCNESDFFTLIKIDGNVFSVRNLSSIHSQVIPINHRAFSNRDYKYDRVRKNIVTFYDIKGRRIMNNNISSQKYSGILILNINMPNGQTKTTPSIFMK